MNKRARSYDVFQADGTLMEVDTPIPPGEAIEVTYYYVYVKSHEIFSQTALFANRQAFNQCLTLWNKIGHDKWIYSEEKPEEKTP